MWGFANDGSQVQSFPEDGGNTGGYARIDASTATGGWSVLVSNGNAVMDISLLGLTAGETYTFQWDMRSSQAGQTGAMKIETFNASGGITANSGDVADLAAADTWGTYTLDLAIPADTTT